MLRRNIQVLMRSKISGKGVRHNSPPLLPIYQFYPLHHHIWVQHSPFSLRSALNSRNGTSSLTSPPALPFTNF